MFTISALVILVLVVGLLTGWISQKNIAIAETYRDKLVARFPALLKLQEKFGPKDAAPAPAPVANTVVANSTVTADTTKGPAA